MIGIIGKGYIGSHLDKYIRAQGEQPVIFTRNNYQDIVNYNFEYFYNCAGNTGDFRENLLQTVDDNVELTNFLLKNLKTKKLLFLSSTRIYGNSNNPSTAFSEDHNQFTKTSNLDFIYNGSKMLCESMILEHADKNNYIAVIIRLSNIIGSFNHAELDNKTLIKKIIKAAITKSSIEINSNPESGKDYIHIDDAIRGIYTAANKVNTSDIYNIASGVSLSFNKIGKLLNTNIICNEANTAEYSRINIDKSKNQFGFTPKVDINQINLRDVYYE